MYHRISGRKFNRNTGHRKALLKNLVKALVTHESIQTTVPKAKDLRPLVEKIVTLGKVDSLHNRRNIISMLGGDAKVATKIMEVLSKRYQDRQGGYLRIIKTGFRKGDCAPMSTIQFV
ncbi:50S ribosomal protein L17 [Alphaproteobacteria bacterium]